MSAIYLTAISTCTGKVNARVNSAAVLIKAWNKDTTKAGPQARPGPKHIIVVFFVF